MGKKFSYKINSHGNIKWNKIYESQFVKIDHAIYVSRTPLKMKPSICHRIALFGNTKLSSTQEAHRDTAMPKMGNPK
jgi:hypothetical protein